MSEQSETAALASDIEAVRAEMLKGLNALRLEVAPEIVSDLYVRVRNYMEALRTLLTDAERERDADKARLDWIERNTTDYRYGGMLIGRSGEAPGELWEIGETREAGFNGWSQGEGKTLREAIDAARASYPDAPPASRTPDVTPP